MKEKKYPNKFMRERGERIGQNYYQTSTRQHIRTRPGGRYSEGCRRAMKVRMRSQMVVEEIMARKGELADDTEHKDIWIKRDMNLEEREKEKC
ncbi:hypothetical protein E2C01_007782 [Portunus trituberculatus]|uniref:Uncharacterized protein n=1 Tax=Portunus trituberculatus TaxID=210409 RepID=A0A5B7D1C0_PORTR|nr:hypothetical protein [Portunus trituberculatus]